MDIHTQIMRAVLRVIGSEGIGGVTNRRIAQEAGVSLGSITYHFETKEEMLRKSLALFVREETERLLDLAIERQRQGVTREQAMAMVEQVAESITFGPEQIGALELFVHAGRDAEMRDYARFCFEAYENVASTVLKGLGVHDPEPLVGPVVALIAGLQLRRLATGGTGSTGIADSLLMLLDRFLPTDPPGTARP